MKNLAFLLLSILIISNVGCVKSSKYVEAPEYEAVAKSLDAWHKAAADADIDAYFSHFHSDSSIFMGTDAAERWTVAEFHTWSKPFFEKGKAWSFKAVKRNIYFSSKGETAWFDEVLDTPNLGPCRGTGVLLKTDDSWKISHYNLSVPIPNSLVKGFVMEIDSVLKQ